MVMAVAVVVMVSVGAEEVIVAVVVAEATLFLFWILEWNLSKAPPLWERHNTRRGLKMRHSPHSRPT
jgi:hypothetical protein